MKKIKSTHKWSTIFSFVKILSNILIGVILIIVIHSPLQNYLSDHQVVNPTNRDFIIIAIFLFLAIFVTVLHILVLNRFYDSLSTFFYILKELDTVVTLRDANYLKILFEPAYMKENKWISMQNIKCLPKNLRRKTILDTAKKIYDKQVDIKKVGENIKDE
ncbi:MAG: hypothetical protein PHY08_01915 [Candidatus Cloacimonetes bacterium]|nr:hypothetical protein [Candidatus Cloacimonadota bacterium]